MQALQLVRCQAGNAPVARIPAITASTPGEGQAGTACRGRPASLRQLRSGPIACVRLDAFAALRQALASLQLD